MKTSWFLRCIASLVLILAASFLVPLGGRAFAQESAKKAAVATAGGAALMPGKPGGALSAPAAVDVKALAQSAGAAKLQPKANDMDTTMLLNLNNTPIDQLVKFLSDNTGKPVLKNKNVNCQITVNSPVPVSKRRAMELIYDALLMENTYIVEMDSQLQILPADALKGLRMKTFGDGDDLQDETDSYGLAQKIYRLQNVGAEDLKNQLLKFIPETVMSLDSKANTFVLTDQISRLKHYDRLIKALDATGSGDKVIEIFKLKCADAMEVASLIGKILSQNSSSSGGGGGGGGSSMPPEMMMAMNRFGGGGGGGGSSAPSSVTAGNVTIVADPGMNWLIVSCPKRRLAEVKRLVAEFDQVQPKDVQARMIDIKHIDVASASNAVSQLFMDTSSKAEKDQVRVVPATDGNRLIVMSSDENFKLIKNLVANMDTDQAEKKINKTYKVAHIQAKDLADQLTKLYEEKNNDSMSWWWGGGGNQNTETKPSFVPSPRTGTLMVLAKPKDFEFINKMVKELDVPSDSAGFAPHIYSIKHTDANELVKVLETLFKEKKQDDTGDSYWRWRSGSDDKKGGPFDGLFGDIRFVVDNVTNRIVALSSNPKDYEVLEGFINQMDKENPETTQVLVVDLKYADAIDISDRLNNLFSDGAVQQPNNNPQQPDQQNGQQNGQNKNSNDEENKKVTEAVRKALPPWWQGSQRDKKDGEIARPINTMIGNVRIVPDTRSNQILVAAPPIYFDALKTVIEKLDQPEPQVYITARIVEVTHGNDRRIGVRWTPDPGSVDPAELDNAFLGLSQLGFLNAWGGNAATKITQTSAFPTGTARGIDTARNHGNVVLNSNVNLALLVQLLVKNSNARVISEPGISVNNNQTGNIFFGSEFPFQTNSQVTEAGSTINGNVYKKVGINLDITPHINTKGEVFLKAALENSNIRQGETVNGQIIKDLREFSTELAIDSGQTMVIGGILLHDDNQINRSVPILGSIPLVKYLFSKKDDSNMVRELVFFITPEVLKRRSDDDRILRRTNEGLERIDKFDGGNYGAPKGPGRK